MKLTAAPTFRDLGGVTVGEGRRVRRGVVYRAGHLLDPSDVERTFVRELGLRRVFDLRSAAERAHQPSNWLAAHVSGDGPRDVHADVNADVRAGKAALLHLLEADCSVGGARQMMLQTYRSFPRAFAGQLRPLFDALLDEEGVPLLVHCTAGKDRTGFACAMLLHALGADEADIYADYLRTGDVLVQSPLADSLGELLSGVLGRPLEPAAIAVIMGVHEEFLATALEVLREEFGSLDRYLEQCAGLDAARRERLREVLLQPV